MNKILVVIICAATQLPKKLITEIEKALGDAGFAQQNTEYMWTITQVIHHSDKTTTVPAPDIDPDATRDSIVKIYAHYIEVTTMRIHRAEQGNPEIEAIQR